MENIDTPKQLFWFERWIWWVLFALAIYFGVILIPEWWPELGFTTTYYLYLLSLPIVLLGMVAAICWGMLGVAIAKWNDSPVRPFHQHALLLSLGGLGLFALVRVASHLIVGDLPTGSYSSQFVTSKWQEPKSAQYAIGDITIRQKMLGDAVARILPGRNRNEIEEQFGPSLQTEYFKEKGYDLIYILGPQRNSFFAIDSEWLLIWLDESGVFQRYEICTD